MNCRETRLKFSSPWGDLISFLKILFWKWLCCRVLGCMFYDFFLCQMNRMVFHLFLCFLSGIKGYKWVLPWQLLLLTFFFYYMLFQLDILLCLGFDSSGYSESVKGQIIFQRVRTPFTRLLWTLFLPAVEGACFLNSFPILACFSSAMFTLWVFGMRSYKDTIHIC